MSEIVTAKNSGAPITSRARRSTRMLRAVPLKVTGDGKTGATQVESTSALAVNCHGCVYQSRYEYRSGSWVTLEVLSQQLGGHPHGVRAQVKFVRLPRNPRELYQVGVELESPGNIWGIPSPPQDWLRFPGPVNGTSAVAAAAISAIESERHKATQIFAPDQLQRALQGMLQQAAERALASAIASHLTPAVNQAARAIDNFSQASVRKVEQYCARTREKVEICLRQEFLARMQADIAGAQQQLRKQIDSLLTTAQNTVRHLEATAAEIPDRVAAAQAALQSQGRDLQSQFSAELCKTADLAASEFRDEAGQVAARTGAVIDQATGRLKETIAEAHAGLEIVANRSAAKFQAFASSEIDRVASDLRESAKAALASFAAETRAEWDSRQQGAEREVARLAQQQLVQFRQRLETILNSAMDAALSAANEHSRMLFDSLLRETAQQLREGSADTP